MSARGRVLLDHGRDFLVAANLAGLCMGSSQSGNHRLAILLTGAFFVVSLAILAWVDERRGRRTVEKTP